MTVEQVIKIKGHVTLIATDPKTGKEVDRVEVDNLVTTHGLILLTRFLIEDSGWDTGIAYTAVGIGATAPVISDSILESEHRRDTPSLMDRATSTAIIQTLFSASTVNVAITEVGLFGHSTASASTDSGELFARALLSYDNSGGSPNDLTIEWRVAFS